MQQHRPKVLVLATQSEGNLRLVEAMRPHSEVVQIKSIDEAIGLLRSERFDAIFSDSSDFLPLERALVSQQASLILNTLGEGVCIVDGEARCNWMNRKMQAWPARVHEKIRRTCQEAFNLFSRQVTPPGSGGTEAAPFNRSKRYALNVDDQQYLEMIASPVISPTGAVVQVVAVVWDATSTRRLQQKIDAIDGAGRELMRIEADVITKLNVGERLKLLEEKITTFTRDLMHFDHFMIRLLDRKTNKLELVIVVGIPMESANVELHAELEGNGITGFVAASGRSYICPDVERDPRYIVGLDRAKSSLTVPLKLHDKVIGVFNIESRQKAAFNEDDRQFAEIFGRYIAMSLNLLDLLRGERVETRHQVADDVCAEAAGPLNDIVSDAKAIMEEYIGNDDMRQRLQAVLDNVATVRKCLRQAAEGPNTLLGVGEIGEAADPIVQGARILVADDEPNIRATISDVLRKYRAVVTVASCGQEAVSLLERQRFDLVLSDIRMPDRSGYDVFAAARRSDASLPVILMTGFGYDPNHSIVRASHEGLQAVLFKPFKVQQLISEIRKAIEQARSVRPVTG